MSSRLLEIGQRLRAYRMGAGLSAEQLGERLNMSRATVYRLETQGVDRIDTLNRVATLLGVSLETLLGVGVEYVPSAISYFERLRQIEANAEKVFVAFGPIVYLLTSNMYDIALRQALVARTTESANRVRRAVDIDSLMAILASRKEQYSKRQPSITNVLSAPELVRFAERGLADDDASPAVVASQQEMARHELERIAEMLETPPMGVQIGVLFDELPTTSFSVLNSSGGSTAMVSPFRVGPKLNVWRGVGMISQAAESIRLHNAWARELWGEVITGQRAADYVRRQITAGSRPAAA